MPRQEKGTRVIDGDTFETNVRSRPIRLARVDTPERGEPGHSRARDALQALIGGRRVSIDTKARDTYGRAVALVSVGGKSVNKQMQKYGK